MPCLAAHSAHTHASTHTRTHVDADAAQASLGIRVEYYAFRWLTTLMSREFALPDTLRLWDSFLADPARFDLVYYVAVAFLVCVFALLRCRW